MDKIAHNYNMHPNITEYKVNAKQCINKVELKQIHPEMQEYLENKLQTKVNILNGATAEGNKTIDQLKKEEILILI